MSSFYHDLSETGLSDSTVISLEEEKLFFSISQTLCAEVVDVILWSDRSGILGYSLGTCSCLCLWFVFINNFVFVRLKVIFIMSEKQNIGEIIINNLNVVPFMNY